MDGHDFDRSEMLQHFEAAAGQKTLSVDVERYDHMLEDSGLSPEQRAEVLQAMWNMMVCFMDVGFTIAPLQESCGKDAEKPLSSAFKDLGALDSLDHEKD